MSYPLGAFAPLPLSQGESLRSTARRDASPHHGRDPWLRGRALRHRLLPRDRGGGPRFARAEGVGLAEAEGRAAKRSQEPEGRRGMTISRQGNLKQNNKNQEAPRPHRERQGGVTGALRSRDVASVPKRNVAVPKRKVAVPNLESALTPENRQETQKRKAI